MANHLISLPDEIKKSLLTASWVDDLYWESGFWNTVEGDTGSVVTSSSSATNGEEAIATASDNEEAYFYTDENYKYILNKPFMLVVRAKFTEVDTSAHNAFIGFMDGVAANALVDNGGGPKATFDGCGFYKIDGETKWHFITSDATTKIDTTLDLTFGPGDHQTFAILVEPYSSTNYKATPFVDTEGGNALQMIAENGASARAPLVSHDATYTTPTDMAVMIGVKQGGATGTASRIDLVAYAGKR